MNNMSQVEDDTKTKLATPEDYISWIEDWLVYRGLIGLRSWESRPQDTVPLTLVSDVQDGWLEQGYLDLNSCLGNAVRNAERDKYLQTLVFNHRNLAPRAIEILDNRIDREISDPAIVEDLKRVDTKLTDKIIGLSRGKLSPPEYTIHLLGTRPKGEKLLSDMTSLIRSFRVPLSASFEEFVAKLYGESLIFWPKGYGVNCGYNLEDGAWFYCLLSVDNGVVSKARKITRKPDYLALLKTLSQDLIDKVVLWNASLTVIIE